MDPLDVGDGDMDMIVITGLDFVNLPESITSSATPNAPNYHVL